MALNKEQFDQTLQKYKAPKTTLSFNLKRYKKAQVSKEYVTKIFGANGEYFLTDDPKPLKVEESPFDSTTYAT